MDRQRKRKAAVPGTHSGNVSIAQMPANKRTSAKKTLAVLRKEACSLGIPTKGTRLELERRIELYREKNLNTTLISPVKLIPALDLTDFVYLPPYKLLHEKTRTDVQWFVATVVYSYFEVRQALAGYKHGRELLRDNFLKNVCFAQIADDSFQVRAYCSATMKKTQLYQVKFEICSKRQQITKSNCECVAGAGNSSACKHVAALLCCFEEFVTTGHVIQDPGCTNALQSWHKPPKNAPKDLINESIENILAKRMQKSLRINCAVPALADNAQDKQTTDELINLTLNAGLSSTMHTNRVVNVIGLANDHDYEAKSIYEVTMETINEVSSSRAIDIEFNTREQSSSNLWYEVRKSRITASKIKNILTAVKTSKIKNIPCKTGPCRFNFYKKDLSKVPQIAWGQSRESMAFEKFVQSYKGVKTFRKSGIHIDITRNYLAASPDGVCCCGEEILEIKCPYSIRFAEPTIANCLDKEGVLLKSHEYYYQIQFQLHVVRAKICHFIVYTLKGIHCQLIEYDKQFVEALLPELHDFYMYVFCKEYCTEFGFTK